MNSHLTRRTLVYGCLLALPMVVQNAAAHGYVSSPESRAFACKQGGNANCGAIVFEPQSLEGPDGFPQAGPADGQLASAGVGRFSELDAQTANRWSKSTIGTGPVDFRWRFTANHVTEGWRYFITKPGWNPNAPLGRSAFDLTPFCTHDGNFQQPPAEVTHGCSIPSDRNGYHVILAVWDIGDTSNAFYNVIDVNINGDDDDNEPPSTSWQAIGVINPVQDLDAGDRVRARVFDANGENPELESSITIASGEDGRKDVWTRTLAREINTKDVPVRAGIMDAEGAIVPAFGRNDIFTEQGSGIERVEITIEQDQPPVPEFQVSGIEEAYTIADGEATVLFTVTSSEAFTLENAIFDGDNRQVGIDSGEAANGSYQGRIDIDSAREGEHTLVVTVRYDNGQTSQQSFGFRLEQGDSGGEGFDHVYPENIRSYQAGTRVQGSDGNIYQCRPWPQSGWCTVNAPQYNPGVGSHWEDAWVRVNN